VAGHACGEFRGIKPAGAKVEFSGMVFWRVGGGKIRERWGLVDAATLMQQLNPAIQRKGVGEEG
jgi:predicted ester cyclase